MKKVFLCAILASLSYPAIASSLQDQLSAVAEAEQQGKNEEQRQHDEWVAERNREIQQEKQRRANAQAAANKRAATAAANKKARQDKLDAEASADKKRDQSYEDELRSLEIQKQKLAGNLIGVPLCYFIIRVVRNPFYLRSYYSQLKQQVDAKVTKKEFALWLLALGAKNCAFFI